jgi:GTP-binding protein
VGTSNSFVTSLVTPDTLDKYQPNYLFLGKSNVGKSSLINFLLRETTARTSKNPGKTQTFNVYRFEDKYLVDAPGYGYANISKQLKMQIQNMINLFLSYKFKIVFIIIESTRLFSPLDIEVLKALIAHQQNFKVILNKIDKVNQKELAMIKNNPLIKENESRMIYFSCTKPNLVHRTNFFQ